MPVLQGLMWLLVCQSLGEAMVRLLHLSLPGPVVGLMLLLMLLPLRGVQAPVGAAAETLLSHLSLLFVPVGVGVMTHLALLSTYGLRMLATIVLSTWIGLVVTALVLRALLPPAVRPAAAAAAVTPTPR